MGDVCYSTNTQIYKKIQDFARVCFTKRQKIIFEEIFRAENQTNASNFVFVMSKRHAFSETSIWYTLKKFKKMGLVEFGDFNSKGKTIMLTGFGKIICRSTTKGRLSVGGDK